MTQKGKEKAHEPEMKKKKNSRTEKQQEREKQSTRAMLAQEARRGRGCGGALRITERETRQSSHLARRGEKTHQVITEGVQMEEYTKEQIQWMDAFHRKHQTSVLAPNSCALHASSHWGPKTRGGGLSGRKRSRGE